jgi:hypothetical protein
MLTGQAVSKKKVRNDGAMLKGQVERSLKSIATFWSGGWKIIIKNQDWFSLAC